MANTHTSLKSLFSDIADAIRTKTGSTALIVADDFPTEIGNIHSGGSATEDLLWTNPDSSVSFSPQTVTLSGDLSEYEYVKVGYRLSTTISPATEYFAISYRYQLPTDINTSNTYVGSIGFRAGSYYYSRAYGAPSNTSIIFGDSIRTSSTLNTSLIPLHIYGVNT